MRTKRRGWMGTRGTARTLVMLAAITTATACYRHTYHVGAGAPTGALVYENWRHHWIAGLISPDREVGLRDVCPSGNATFHQEATFLNGLVGILTSGIYVPTTVTIRCQSGADLGVELSSEDVERIVTDPGFLGWVREAAPDRLDEAVEAQSLLDRD